MTTAELESKTVTIPTARHLIAGRYRAGSRIGHGRLGDVFAATDENIEGLGVEQQLAIQISPELVLQNNKLFNKLSLGYTILRAAAHPNIVTYRHFGRDGKFAFLLMDRLDGLSLRAVLDDAGTLTPDEAKPVIRGVGEALRLLHSKDMLHANLTTRNVFITHDFEVRLLDVLPVDASESILRGPVARGLFGPCTVADDVFGLASLSYEMLTGRHPFNHGSPADAPSAGIPVERIDSLTESESAALRRALSLDVGQRTPSVAEFMREFGIDGNERLRPSVDQPDSRESVDYAAMEKAPPIMRLAAPAQAAATAAPVPAVDPVPWVGNRPPVARPEEKRPRPLRAILLAMLLAGLGAWTQYGDPQEQIAAWIHDIESRVLPGGPDRGVQSAEAPTATPVRTVSTDPDAVDARSAAAASVTVGDELPEDVTAPTVAGSVADTSARSTSSLEQGSAAPAVGEVSDDTRDEAASGVDNVAPASVDEAQATPGSVFAEPVVSVSERDGVARIPAPQIGYVEAPLIWWTSEHTARADTDFVSVEHPFAADATIEGGDVLLVPLVNDSFRESPESFFVSIGSRDSRHGQIERIATVRVDIIDDD